MVRTGAEERDTGRVLGETSERLSTKRALRAACVDMWEPFRQSLEEWVPRCRIIYDKECAAAHSLSYVESFGMCHAVTVPAE